MRSLRKLWGFALAATALALVMGCWLLPGRADATVPQAPNQPSVLTVSASGSGSTLNISGSLTAGGQPISGAVIIITLDTQTLGPVSTGGDGSYSTSTNLPGMGTHVVTATFGGDKTNRQASATQRFAGGPPTSAPPAPTTVITAQLSPNPVAAGSVLVVSGTLASAGVPIDSARVDITCDFGSTTALGVTDASGAFTANVALPPTGQPSKLTVTVSYAGDNRFGAARATFQASVTAAASPSVVASPSIPTASVTASVAPASSTPTAVQSSGALALQNATTPAAAVGVVLGIVGVGAFIALGVLWLLAWSRRDLLPGERRGFGSDFGRRRRSA